MAQLEDMTADNYLTADVNLAVASDNMLMAASSSPSKPYNPQNEQLVQDLQVS